VPQRPGCRADQPPPTSRTRLRTPPRTPCRTRPIWSMIIIMSRRLTRQPAPVNRRRTPT
jgi:hypothetical protein